MVGFARVVVPGMARPVAQRGNPRQETFFCDDDYLASIELVAKSCRKWQAQIWAHCLDAQPLDLITAPTSEDGSLRS